MKFNFRMLNKVKISRNLFKKFNFTNFSTSLQIHSEVKWHEGSSSQRPHVPVMVNEVIKHLVTTDEAQVNLLIIFSFRLFHKLIKFISRLFVI